MYEYLPPLITASAVVVGAFVARHATRFSARLQGLQRAHEAEIACIREYSESFGRALVGVQAYVMQNAHLPDDGDNSSWWARRWPHAESALDGHAQALWRIDTLPTSELRSLARSAMELLSDAMQPDDTKALRIWNAAMASPDNPAAKLTAALAAEQRRLLDNYPDDVPRRGKRALRAQSRPELPSAGN